MKKILLLTVSSVATLAVSVSLAATDKKPVSQSLTKKGQAVTKHIKSNPKYKAVKPYEPKKKPARRSSAVRLGSFIGMGPQSRIQMNGFLSAGVSTNTGNPPPYKTLSANPISYDQGYVIPDHGIVQNRLGFAPNSLVGLQFTGRIAHDWSAVAQLVAYGSNENGNHAYRVNAEWAFVRYKPNNRWQLRAGRMRIPLFAYSDTMEIGYTYPWVFLPNTVYRVVPFNNFNGADVVFTSRLGSTGWLLHFQPFYGSNQSDYDSIPYEFFANNTSTCSPGRHDCAPGLATFKENDLVGAAIDIGNDYVQLRGSYAHTKLDATAQTAGGFDTAILMGDNAYFYSVGLKFSINWLRIQGEWAARHANRAASGQGSIANLQGYYVMAGAQLGNCFPYITYGDLRTTNTDWLSSITHPVPNLRLSEAPQAEQDWIVGVSYNVNANLHAKASVTRIKPKDGTWGLYNYDQKGKTSYMYAVSLDAVF